MQLNFDIRYCSPFALLTLFSQVQIDSRKKNNDYAKFSSTLYRINKILSKLTKETNKLMDTMRGS